MSVTQDLTTAATKLHQALYAVKGEQRCWCTANSLNWKDDRHSLGCKRAIFAVQEFERVCNSQAT